MDRNAEFTTRVWLNSDHAARYLKLDRRAIDDACSRGDLRHVFVSDHREIRIRLDWLESWWDRVVIHRRDEEDDDPEPDVA
jgi:hypothetical protein